MSRGGVQQFAPTPGLAYEARKAPGGSYHHNIFHQAEHLTCMLRTAIDLREAPEVILFPYTVTLWSAAVVRLLLPGTRLVSTCCGREKVAARWWTGERRVCPCWQRVCPERSATAAFWPGAAGRAAHAAVRAATHRICGLPSGRAKRSAPLRLRLLERPGWASRQLEDVTPLLEAMRTAGEAGLAARAAPNAGATTAATPAGGRVVLERAVAELPSANAAAPDTNSSAYLAAFLCHQVRWFHGANVVVLAHGAQTTNAIFAGSGTLVVDLLPFAHKPEPAAPQDYYAALLENTDVAYTTLPTQRPDAAPLLRGAPRRDAAATGGGANASAAARYRGGLDDDEQRCRDDKACRLAYRDGGDIKLGEAGRAELRRRISEHARRLGQSLGRRAGAAPPEKVHGPRA